MTDNIHRKIQWEVELRTAFPRKLKQKDLSVGFTTISFGLSNQEKKQTKAKTHKNPPNKTPQTTTLRVNYALHWNFFLCRIDIIRGWGGQKNGSNLMG